jgi:PAS domain S-box-containing protein
MKEKELKAYLAAIVESSDDAIVSKDLAGTIQSFNAAAERLFGYTAEEIIGRSVTTLIPPERHFEEQEILARIRAGERIEHFETVRVTKEGRLIDVSLTISPVRGPKGKIIGASKIARDITDQKQSAATLAAQREWFQVTLNSIGDAVISCDANSRVTFLNHEAERLTGWQLGDAVGQPLSAVFQLLDERTRNPIEPPATRHASFQRSGVQVQPVLVSRDGREWPIEDRAAPIVGKDGGVIGTALVFRDVTEERKLADRDRLTAIERERLLQNERLARSEAERANRVKDDFVAMVSHELRTPLNAILGWTEILKQGHSPATLDHGLEVIARNTRLQAQLISDLLDVSRIVSGKLSLELEELDVVPVVLNSVEALQSVAADKGVTMVTRLQVESAQTLGDPARLQQIIWNLLSNAVKFTPKGGVVTTTLRQIGETFEVTVEDTGIGIRPEALPELFERFRQGSSLTTRRHGGLGLGLSIARHLTELHGGSISAWSAGENTGATFTVGLPVQLGDPIKENLARAYIAAETASQVESISFKGLRILVVEDDQDTRDLVRRLLESHRAEVIVAASALEALDLLETERPDVLVSDIGLPDVDGYSLVQRIRNNGSATANIPAVALTAFARSEDRTRALAAGYNAHITKPVEAPELIITIGNLVSLIHTNRDRDVSPSATPVRRARTAKS